MEADTADPFINSHLADMMQGVGEEDAADDGEDQRSPAKSKQKDIHLCKGNSAQA
jgi:hypothetical protein